MSSIPYLERIKIEIFCELEQLVSEGHKARQEMADALGVARSTICYELARFKPYDLELAQ